MEEKKSLKEKFHEKKQEAKEKLHNAKEWCGKHKTELIAFGTVIIPAGVEIVKTVAKKDNLREERELKEKFVYDRSDGMGIYYELNRKLSGKEKLQIRERKADGEALFRILEDMNVLK